MDKQRPMAVSRDFQKRDLQLEDGSNRVVSQNDERPENKNNISEFSRRDVLRNLAPSVAKSVGQLLREFKVNTFEVLDKLGKKP
ncbi:MAG: hypothetical protein IPM57_06410 [Oligoflexia bacterium]|nr:hypothetical protein [Oligoflexia bacterium]